MYMLGITIAFLPICPKCPGRAIPKGKLQKHPAVETAGDDGQFYVVNTSQHAAMLQRTRLHIEKLREVRLLSSGR